MKRTKETSRDHPEIIPSNFHQLLERMLEPCLSHFLKSSISEGR